MKKLQAVTVALCALALSAGTAVAAGGPTDYPTFFVDFEYSQKKFTGKIDSAKGKCVNDRKIFLYRKKGGDKKKLDADLTNNKGKFKFGVGKPKDGTYFARVKTQSAGSDSCQGERSAKVEIG